MDPSSVPALPRVTISFCTQCKWMLRAAYFAQELLSTFSTSLGEVALQPSTGGTFVVTLYTAAPENANITGDGSITILKHVLWDRKSEGRFPETKELKRRVRDVIDPDRDLGHVDGNKATTSTSTTTSYPSTSSTSSTPSTPSTPSSSQTATQPQIPNAINRHHLQHLEERKLTPMDIDSSDLGSSVRSTTAETEGQVLNSRGKVQVTAEGLGLGMDEMGDYGYCRPGEDC